MGAMVPQVAARATGRAFGGAVSPCRKPYVLSYLRQLPEHGFHVTLHGRQVDPTGRPVDPMVPQVAARATGRFSTTAVPPCRQPYVSSYLRQLPEHGFQVTLHGRQVDPTGRQVDPMMPQVAARATGRFST